MRKSQKSKNNTSSFSKEVIENFTSKDIRNFIEATGYELYYFHINIMGYYNSNTKHNLEFLWGKENLSKDQVLDILNMERSTPITEEEFGAFSQLVKSNRN